MRFSSIVAAGIVVLVVAVVVFVALRGAPETPPPEDFVAEEAPLLEPVGNGQFLQEIPHEAVGESPSPTVSGEEPDATATPPASVGTVTGQASITMSETGFSPATLTVKAGTAVSFVNNGQAAHWPASDVHPTHQLLPDFDAKHGLATGEAYSYTFTKPGTWECHDHLMPQHTCVITVSE